MIIHVYYLTKLVKLIIFEMVKKIGSTLLNILTINSTIVYYRDEVLVGRVSRAACLCPGRFLAKNSGPFTQIYTANFQKECNNAEQIMMNCQ